MSHPSTYLTSSQNPKIKELLGLREKRDRDRSGLFLIEGYRELLRAIDNGWDIVNFFFCNEFFLGDNEGSLIQRIASQGADLYECAPHLFEKISYRDRPDGLLAIAKQRALSLSDLDRLLKTKSNPLIVVAEAIEKPGNLGTILRSADGVAADALILCDRCTDLYNPNVVRASVGTLFTVPTVQAGSKEAIEWLKKHHVHIVAATPHAKKNYTNADLKQAVAIAMGTEQLGLSDKWMKESDIHVRIPMAGVADSLNVAMATTLLLYEVYRQRHDNEQITP